MDTSDQATVRALRRLAIAVWALVLVVAVSAVVPMMAYLPWLMSMWSHSEGPGAARSSASSLLTTPHEKFHELPIEKQIAAASVIAIAKYQKDGEKLKCVVSEVLKRSPDTAFYFKVGDEFPDCSRYPRPDVSYGEGMVMFFVGNPAQMRYSTSIYENRLIGVGDMPVDLLRRKIAEAK